MGPAEEWRQRSGDDRESAQWEIFGHRKSRKYRL